MPVNFYAPLYPHPPAARPAMLYDGHSSDKILCFGCRLLLLGIGTDVWMRLEGTELLFERRIVNAPVVF